MTGMTPVGGSPTQPLDPIPSSTPAPQRGNGPLSGRVVALGLVMALVAGLAGGAAYAGLSSGPSGPASQSDHRYSVSTAPPMSPVKPECREADYTEVAGNRYTVVADEHYTRAEAVLGIDNPHYAGDPTGRLHVETFGADEPSGQLQFILPATSDQDPRRFNIQAADGFLHVAQSDAGFTVRGEGQEITVVAAGIQSTIVATGGNGMKAYLAQQDQPAPRFRVGEALLTVPNDGVRQPWFDVPRGANDGSIFYDSVVAKCPVTTG